MNAVLVAFMLTLVDLILGCGLAALLDHRQFTKRQAGLVAADPARDAAFIASRTTAA